MTTYNSDIPEELTHKSMPTEAIVGHLTGDQTVDEFTAAMATADIDNSRIHILTGDDGIAVLQNMGTRLSRMFGPDRDRPIELLRSGATLVGVFAVADDQQAQTTAALRDAGITILHRFGKWSYS